jgi:hypothetical protein
MNRTRRFRATADGHRRASSPLPSPPQEERAGVWTFTADAKGVSSYQPGATPQEKRANKVGLSANGAIHKASNLQLVPECGYDAGRWPANHIHNRIPGALPRAGMIDAFGVEMRPSGRRGRGAAPQPVQVARHATGRKGLSVDRGFGVPASAGPASLRGSCSPGHASP